MNKISWATFFGLFAVVLGGIFLFGGDKSAPVDTGALPWVEVLKPGVFSAARELKTGDELRTPATIKTNSTGLANIYFPDGSVARLDSNTELVLEEGSYDGADKTLRVKMLELATPRSSWEVKTANAVATVRGTAFGVEYISGKTTVVGSEHSVAVANLDQNTSTILLESQVMTVADGVVEVRAKKSLEAEWVERFESADGKVEVEGLTPAVIEPVEKPRQFETQVESFVAPILQPAPEKTEPSTETIIAPTNDATVEPASFNTRSISQ